LSIAEAAGTFEVKRGKDNSLVTPADLPPAEHFIGGEFRSGSGGHTTDVIDPSNESTFARVASGTTEDVDLAVAAAVRARKDWGRRRTPKQRAEVLLAIADRLEENSELLVRLEAVDTGKPLMVARDDIDQSIDTFRFMAGAARAITSQAAADYAENHLSVIIREPLGVVGAITPWNYPLLMGIWKIAPVLAAGNTMVIKPAEVTPLTRIRE
jgi:aminobutyraldehyde dehydrogenase